jgi:hypothetical protein
MYGSHSIILLRKGNIQLRKSVQHKHSYLKSGRGTIKTEVRYHVEYVDNSTTENYSGVYNITKKIEAVRIFNQVCTYGMGSLAQGWTRE